VPDVTNKFAIPGDEEFIDHLDASNTSITEYDEKVLGFVSKSGDVWTCNGCAYSSKNKTHVKEHAEMHVEGYSHTCNYCGKVYSVKRSLRQHRPKCRKEVSQIPLDVV